MSAIGDYIHWSYGGYVEKTGKHAGPYKEGAAAVIQNRSNIIDKWVSQQGYKNKAKELEKALNNKLAELKSLRQPGRGDATPLRDNAQAQALAEDLAEVLPKKYVRADLVQSIAAGTLRTGAYKGGVTNIKGSGTKVQTDAYQIVKTQMENYVNSYTTQIEKALSVKEQINQKDIESYLNKINNSTKTFLQQVGQLTAGKGGGSYETEFKRYQQEIKKIYKQLETLLNNKNTKNSGDLINLCKELANGLSAGIGANNYIGDLGEAIAMIAGKSMAKSVVTEVKNLGQEVSQRGLNKIHFSGIVEIENLTKSTQKIGPYQLTSDAPKQDLVDVSITLDTGKQMNLSIKTRKPNSHGSFNVDFQVANILELLQNENKDDFINHYLNLNAVKGLQNSTDKKDINALVKKLIAAKMIAGYQREVVNKDYLSANYFVIIDSVNYKAYVIPMSQLLKYIFVTKGYEKINIPTNLISANQFVPGDGGIIVRINNVMKRLAVSSSASYSFSPSALETMK